MERLNQTSSQEQKKNTSEAVFDQLTDYLFDKVLLLNNPQLVTSTGNNSTTNYTGLLRVPDTSRGRYVRPDKKSRFRTAFYISGGGNKADAYILTPCVYLSESSPTSFTSMNIFDSYVGIKILAGDVFMATKSKSGERLIKSRVRIPDNSTNVLDIEYNISHANIYINGEQIGSIDANMTESLYSLITTYPLIAPIRSTDGTTVTMNIENYQFLQDR
jgi:hypothetical protein